MTSNNNKNATVKGTRAPNDLRLTTISQRTKMIDRGTIDKIMNATDIVDVVKEFVTLRKAGVNYKGLCPFHDEKTPSFVVSPAKQLCKCFSCGKGGNAVHFIMEHEQMTYPEALRWLAKKYGIEVHEKEATEEEKKNASLRESMFVLNEWARDYFSSILHNHADGIALGMSYFRKEDSAMTLSRNSSSVFLCKKGMQWLKLQLLRDSILYIWKKQVCAINPMMGA